MEYCIDIMQTYGRVFDMKSNIDDSEIIFCFFSIVLLLQKKEPEIFGKYNNELTFHKYTINNIHTLTDIIEIIKSRSNRSQDIPRSEIISLALIVLNANIDSTLEDKAFDKCIDVLKLLGINCTLKVVFEGYQNILSLYLFAAVIVNDYFSDDTTDFYEIDLPFEKETTISYYKYKYFSGKRNSLYDPDAQIKKPTDFYDLFFPGVVYTISSVKNKDVMVQDQETISMLSKRRTDYQISSMQNKVGLYKDKFSNESYYKSEYILHSVNNAINNNRQELHIDEEDVARQAKVTNMKDKKFNIANLLSSSKNDFENFSFLWFSRASSYGYYIRLLRTELYYELNSEDILFNNIIEQNIMTSINTVIYGLQNIIYNTRNDIKVGEAHIDNLWADIDLKNVEDTDNAIEHLLALISIRKIESLLKQMIAVLRYASENFVNMISDHTGKSHDCWSLSYELISIDALNEEKFISIMQKYGEVIPEDKSYRHYYKKVIKFIRRFLSSDSFSKNIKDNNIVSAYRVIVKAEMGKWFELPKISFIEHSTRKQTVNTLINTKEYNEYELNLISNLFEQQHYIMYKNIGLPGLEKYNNTVIRLYEKILSQFNSHANEPFKLLRALSKNADRINRMKEIFNDYTFL